METWKNLLKYGNGDIIETDKKLLDHDNHETKKKSLRKN